MERRTQEAVEFFQEQEEDCSSSAIKSDDSEDDDWTDKSTKKGTKPLEDAIETPEINDTQMNESHETEILSSAPDASESAAEYADATDLIDNDIENNNQTSTAEKSTELDATPPPTKASNVIQFHTERTELDDELDAMLELETRPKPSISTDYVPKLKGGDGFLIDLETNDLKPKSQEGINELFSRFIKNACVKKNVTPETQNVKYDKSNLIFLVSICN